MNRPKQPGGDAGSPRPPVGAIPKAEIHVHLEGAAPPALARRKARERGAPIDDICPDGEGYRWSDFSDFLAAYDRVAALFRSPQDFAELAESYLDELAEQGAIYAEIFISPDTAAVAGLDWADYLDGIADGVARAHARTGIICRLIPCAVRQNGPQAAVDTARRVAARPHPLVTGFGLAGDERQFRPSEFVPAFLVAAEAGLGLTAHAGEICGADSVRATIDALPVSRIGHGIQAIDDPALVQRLAREGIVLEVCPGSNVCLGLYPDRLRHPLQALRAAGVRVTVNSDDPPFFQTSLANEYRQTAAALGWADDVLVELTANAIEAAFVDEETRHSLVKRLDAATACR